MCGPGVGVADGVDAPLGDESEHVDAGALRLRAVELLTHCGYECEEHLADRLDLGGIRQRVDENVVDALVANLHPDVFIAIGRTQPVQPNGALGVLESFNVATLVRAADAAAKAAAVQLLEIRLAMALGGKAFVTLTGDVGSVQASVAAGRAVLAEAGVLVNAVVISRPHPEVYREVI